MKLLSYTDEETGHGVRFWIEEDRLRRAELAIQVENGESIKQRLPLKGEGNHGPGAGAVNRNL